MTTAVVSPPSFQSLPRLGWNGGYTNSGGFSVMSNDEPSRMFVPQRKVVTRSSSSSSLASNSSTGSTSTIIQSEAPSAPHTNGETANIIAKKKARGGFWPVSKTESTSGVSNARANGAVQPANPNNMGAKNALQQPGGTQPHSTANGARTANGQMGSMEQTAVLALLPINGTFERKQINVPYYPDILKIGRQTNAKTVPTQVNGFFDSKVLSRSHAEIWAERGSGKIWIRDVKSSNGTFVNGQRLSPENRESEPHELRQHDTLELGIDIVSEDQKTIVHHKVSAKVEFAGLPGNSNNVLDLNFGDLDPSHGGSLLVSPISQPMVQSRSRPGGPPNGRAAVSLPPSMAGGQMSSVAQQRQANFWGSPLNIEQLVKHLATEMRAAKQQSQDLDQANSFLGSVMTPDGSPSKGQTQNHDSSVSRPHNSRARAPRVDHAARFGDPPAPPPQQPLPEKPDSAKLSPVNTTSIEKMLKRSETAKSVNGLGHSPSGSQNSQILSLVQALEIAKKELDSQSVRVKQLEDMLDQERSAREAAEQRAKRIEETSSAKPITTVEDESQEPDIRQEVVNEIESQEPMDTETKEHVLQQRLDSVVAEMQKMKAEMEQASGRAEAAEQDAIHARSSLTEMIERLRQENASEVMKANSQADSASSVATTEDSEKTTAVVSRGNQETANGHVRAPSRLPQHLERAMATVMRENSLRGDLTAQSAPYVSMLGVVLIGVGVMAYLNAWQKGDK